MTSRRTSALSPVLAILCGGVLCSAGAGAQFKSTLASSSCSGFQPSTLQLVRKTGTLGTLRCTADATTRCTAAIDNAPHLSLSIDSVITKNLGSARCHVTLSYVDTFFFRSAGRLFDQHLTFDATVVLKGRIAAAARPGTVADPDQSIGSLTTYARLRFRGEVNGQTERRQFLVSAIRGQGQSSEIVETVRLENVPAPFGRVTLKLILEGLAVAGLGEIDALGPATARVDFGRSLYWQGIDAVYDQSGNELDRSRLSVLGEQSGFDLLDNGLLNAASAEIFDDGFERR